MNLEVADEGIVVNHLSLGSFALGDGHLAPVDFEGVVSFGQWHPVGPAVGVGLPMALGVLDVLLEGVQTRLGLEQVDPFVEGDVGLGLAHEDEMEIVEQRAPAHGLMGVDVVAQERGL